VSTGAPTVWTSPGVLARMSAVARTRRWTVAVWAAMVAWAIVLFDIARDAFFDFRLGRFDLGNMVQAVWSTAHGRPLEITSAAGEQVYRLGYHVDPFLVLLAPVWVLWSSPLALAFVQIAVSALGALPVYWLAERHSGSQRTGALLAAAYLLYPWVAWGALDVFHPVSLATTLLLYGIWFLDADRLLAFGVCAFLVAATGELMGLVIAGLGLWYALARGRRRAGLGIAAGGAVWTIVALSVVVPAFSGGPSLHYDAFSEVGGSPLGIVRTAFSDPLVLVTAATRGEDVVYLLALALPLAGAFLLEPWLAAVGAIPLSVNLLAGIVPATDPYDHYSAGILPFLFAGVAIGIRRLSPSTADRVVGLVLVLCAATSVALGPWPGTSMLKASSWDPITPSSERADALERAVARVPQAAAVSATNRLGSHLSARRYVYSVPVVGSARWIVIESSDAWLPRGARGDEDPVRLAAFLRRIEQSSNWQKVSEEDGVLVFRRKG